MSIKVIKAPGFVNDKIATVFLAGSIEMGAAENWQDRAVKLFVNSGFTLLNPRRDDWDNSWKQEITHPAFNEQVNWELQGLETCEKVIVYFDPNTKAPITLMELGIVSQMKEPEDIFVICPDGFYRKGNVDIVCDRYRIRQYKSLEDACAAILRQN